ncbi:MAG: transglycosylase domain-containing protein [Burkholderiaceae bacterium]
MTVSWLRQLGRLLGLVVVCLLALQLWFVVRVALMAVIDPQSTTFQRSEIFRLASERGRVAWSQQWVPDERIAVHLKRAVIASEDSAFAEHAGVDWEAIERAWDRNQRAEAHAERRNERLERQTQRRAPSVAPQVPPRVEPKVVGGSTITQQLAKNLFLSGERTPLRKAQEFVLTLALEALLTKRRILEIYLNNVEWGEGLFGAQAAARHYHRVDAAQLGPTAAARLAVMLPAPKRFEQRPASPYVAGRAATVLARMPAVVVP